MKRSLSRNRRHRAATEGSGQYPFAIRRLRKDEGGGYLIEFPDLPGCFSDGETVAGAIANGRDAVASWIATAKEFGDRVPSPGSARQPRA